VTATYTNGAGSLGIVAFEAGIPLVAKVGPRAVIDAETAFVTQVNAELAARGNPPLFPVLHGVHHEGAQATSLMEQVEPLTLDNVVFSDKAKFVLADDALSALEPHLRMLGAFYTSATRPQRPTVADYLFRERFHAVVEHEGAETIRQVGAGLAYAHSRQVGHGALTTRAVMGIPRPARGKLMSDGWLDPGLQITDWHHAAAAGAGTPTADAVTRDLRGLAAVAREICAGTPAAGLAELPDRLATEPDFARLDPAQQVQRLTRRLAAAALH
jgi:hypothetical protein